MNVDPFLKCFFLFLFQQMLVERVLECILVLKKESKGVAHFR